MTSLRAKSCVVTFLTAAALGIAGCGSQSSVTVDLPEKNLEQWLMPLDQYMLSADDMVRGDYAATLMEKSCMEEVGFVYAVPWRDLNNLRSESWNPVFRKLFDVDLASRWGYHTAPSPENTLKAWRQFGESLNGLGDEGDLRLDYCIQTVRYDYPIVDTEANYVLGLTGNAYHDALDDPAVGEAADLWRTCMLPAGVPDLPRSPMEMPSDSLLASIDWTEDSTPTSDEIAIAVFDAQCREDSGYSQALYDAEWSHQVEALNKNIDTLERNKNVIDEYVRQTQEIIDTHAITQ